MKKLWKIFEYAGGWICEGPLLERRDGTWREESYPLKRAHDERSAVRDAKKIFGEAVRRHGFTFDEAFETPSDREREIARGKEWAAIVTGERDLF